MKKSFLSLFSLTCLLHLTSFAGSAQLTDDTSAITALQKVFESQERSIKSAISDLAGRLTQAQTLHLNQVYNDTFKQLTNIAQGAYQNIKQLGDEVTKKQARLKDAFKQLQTTQTADGYDITAKTYKANLQPIVTNTDVKLSPETIYSYIFDELNPKTANNTGKNMSAAQIIAKLNEKLSKNPLQKERDWIGRQLGYLFSNDFLKNKYDAFLLGKENFERWEKDNNLITTDTLASLLEKNVTNQTALDTLQSRIQRLNTWVKETSRI